MSALTPKAEVADYLIDRREARVCDCWGWNVRLRSLTDIGPRPLHIRFTPNSGNSTSAAKFPLSAKSRH